jgi:diguanylate cyclase (GGDEF)-like protein
MGGPAFFGGPALGTVYICCKSGPKNQSGALGETGILKLNTKSLLFLVGIMATMILILGLVSLASFREFSIRAAQEHTRTAAEIIRVNLTEAMVNGVIDRRENFLERIAAVEGLTTVKVARSPQVSSQFGDGLASEAPSDEVERLVLETGEAYYSLVGGPLQPEFRATIPYIATASGGVNCLMCHHVPEGTVLGAVTLTTSIAHMKRDAILTVVGLIFVVAVFAFIAVLFYRRMLRPLILTAGEIQHAVERAGAGDFSGRVMQRTDDEIGQIASEFNRLSNSLEDRIGQIRTNVAQLLQDHSPLNGNLLVSTTDMVTGLIRVSHFKQAIEEDETAAEVYERLSVVMMRDLGVERFSVYEVDAGHNRIVPIRVDGLASEECRWCDPQILIRANTCRACRTGHIIDAVEAPDLCNAFGERGRNEELNHICLPVIQSGTVGSVIQIVVTSEERLQIQSRIPLIQSYLREAAPVLQAKRLMDTLRESTLRDPLTGLHNRRFLEEYLDTLVSGATRRGTQLAILMLDLDYFKKVNDTHGHDAGDTILRELAKIFAKNVRSSDMVIRYGGEEFIIILQDTTAEGAAEVAEKIRKAVQENKFHVQGGVLEKTISIGMALFPTDGDAVWQVIKYADVALYRAKDEGRNRVIHFNREMWGDNHDY